MTTGHLRLLDRQNQRGLALPCAKDRWGSCPGHNGEFSNEHGETRGATALRFRGRQLWGDEVKTNLKAATKAKERGKKKASSSLVGIPDSR